MANLVELFDDYVRKCRMLQHSDCTKEFLIFVKNQQQCRLQWKEAVEECQRLRGELDKSEAQISEYEKKLLKARKILADEKRKADRAEAERDELQQQICQVQEIMGNICRAGNQLANETKEKLDKFLNTTNKIRTSEGLYPRLDTIDEVNSTGSLLSDSDVSFSRSEDMLDLDLDSSTARRKKGRKIAETIENAAPPKRRRSSRLNPNQIQRTSFDGIVATTTVSVPRSGPITACSRIETQEPAVTVNDPIKFMPLPSAPPASSTTSLASSVATSAASDSESTDEKIIDKMTLRHAAFTRQHDFVSRTVLRPTEECCACLKTMPFATKMVRCSECKASAHLECRDQVPLPCIPQTGTQVQTPLASGGGTASGQGTFTRLADLCRGGNAPHVPALLLRCVLEIERRGLNELGIYRVPGAEKDVRALKSRFLRGKGACSSLAHYDVHVICGVLKDFLRSLPEPLVTHALWQGFVDAAQAQPAFERTVALYQIISELPVVNRHTLAFIVLHLQKVANCPPCKMSKSNLAMVFGPTLVGYSNHAPTQQEMCSQTPLQAMVVEALMDLAEDYWNNLLSNEPPKATAVTPSYSLRRKNVGKSFKLFSTPPAK